MNIKNIGMQGLKGITNRIRMHGYVRILCKANDAESDKAIKKAYELGITFFDTSDMYGPYKNENSCRKSIEGYKEEGCNCNKVRIMRTDDPKVRGINGRQEYVRSSCDGSLKRLGTELYRSLLFT